MSKHLSTAIFAFLNDDACRAQVHDKGSRAGLRSGYSLIQGQDGPEIVEYGATSQGRGGPSGEGRWLVLTSADLAAIKAVDEEFKAGFGRETAEAAANAHNENWKGTTAACATPEGMIARSVGMAAGWDRSNHGLPDQRKFRRAVMRQLCHFRGEAERQIALRDEFKNVKI